MSHLLSQKLNAISPYNINLFGNTYIFNFKNSDGNNANEDNNNNIYNSIYDNNNNDKTKNESNQNLDKIKDEKKKNIKPSVEESKLIYINNYMVFNSKRKLHVPLKSLKN